MLPSSGEVPARCQSAARRWPARRAAGPATPRRVEPSQRRAAARRRKCTKPRDLQFECARRKGRVNRTKDLLSAIIGDVADEPQCDVKVVSGNPPRRRRGCPVVQRARPRLPPPERRTVSSSSTPTNSLTGKTDLQGSPHHVERGLRRLELHLRTAAKKGERPDARRKVAAPVRAIATVPTGFCGVPPPGPGDAGDAKTESSRRCVRGCRRPGRSRPAR